MHQLNRSQMPHLASDLLKQGLTPSDIIEAVKKAIRVAKLAHESVEQHFQFVYTQGSHGLINDCRLSKFGLGLVLLNANLSEVMARWQTNLLKGQIEKAGQ